MTDPRYSTVPLRRTYFVFNPARFRYEPIATVGEALRYLCELPAKLGGIHWTLASTSLCWAHRNKEAGIDQATLAFDNAVWTDGLYVKTVPAA